MKTIKAWLLAGVVMGGLTVQALAQDPLAVAPEMYKLLFENERVRVMEVTFAPGQKIAPHSHPDHYVVVAEGGTLRIAKPDGTSNDVTVAPNQVIWIAAETHWAENIGETQVRLIVNELKGGAAPAEDAAH